MSGTLVSPFEHAARPGKGLRWLEAAREEALAAFKAQGVPGGRTEGWRFTPADRLAKIAWVPAERPARRGGFAGRALCPIDFHRVVIQNGTALPGGEGSNLGALPAGVTVRSLAQALDDEPEAIKAALSRGFDKDGLPFAALAAGLFQGGVVVRLGRHVRLDKPLQVLLVSDDAASRAPQAAHLRVLVLLEEGAAAEIVEESIGLGEAPFWTNVLTQVSLGEGASLKHYRVQREPEGAAQTSATLVEIGRAARYESHVFSLGGGFSRGDLRVRLAGEGGECQLSGLALARGRELVDHHLVLEHASTGGIARVLYKAVLDEKARYVFDGLAHVRPGAQKTDASIYNKNLLLSEEAQVHTNPEFKIHADDVSCKHGGTIGQLSPESLFYLRSRGVGAEEARRLLVYAFGSEMIARVGVESLRDALASALQARMPEAAEVNP